MRSGLAFGLQAAFLAALSAVQSSEVSPSVQAKFDEFKRNFQRSYGSSEEEGQRLRIFAENLAQIDATNAQNLTYIYGITKFADMTLSEYRERYAMQVRTVDPAPNVASIPPSRPAENLPGSVDWVASGVVTPVLDQGQCGSCWIFGTNTPSRATPCSPYACSPHATLAAR